MIPELLVCGNIARDLIFGNERYGGSAPAIAVNAARLGVSTGLLSVIGKDIFSEQYREYLIQNGINIIMAIVRMYPMKGLSIILWLFTNTLGLFLIHLNLML